MFFQIHTFRIPNLFDVSQYVKNHYQVDSMLAEKLVKIWLIGFCHNLCLFYISQYHRYVSFHEEYQRQDEPVSPHVLAESDFVAAECEKLRGIKNRFEQDIGRGNPRWYLEQMRMGVPDEMPPSLEIELNAYWFNREIYRSPELVSELRRLPYKDYLNTPEWKRVRASLVMIRRAICQAEPCYNIGESFSGDWEAELHVHHLSYSNLGYERYADLALLCKRHHELWHKNAREGNPNFKIFN